MAVTSFIDIAYFKGWSSKIYVLSSILLLSIVAALFRQFSSTPDPRQPPIVASKVPLIGHLLGLIKHDAEYFGILM
jgi:hypothetical protein